MKRVVFFLAALAIAIVPALAQAEDAPPEVVFVFGPRVGAGMSFQDQASFSTGVSDIFGGGPYYPYYSLFGFNLEYRVLLGDSRDHFAIQMLLAGFGLEQSVFIPSGALLMGYRSWTGIEVGIGPVVNPSGIGVIVAVGYTFSFNGVYVPFDVSFQIPNARLSPAIIISTGFNFLTD
jgi:hypothetical protein